MTEEVRILVVDDSAVDQKLAAGFLKEIGEVDVTFVNDGEEALEAVRKETFDLVLTDIQMPNMDGLELVSTLKDEFPLLPVVLMTATGSEAIAVKALQSGAASYVPKNLLGRDLRVEITNVLAAANDDRADADILQRVVESYSQIVIETQQRLTKALLKHLQRIVQSTKGIEQADHARLGIALGEALSNALFHGNLEVSSELREEDDSEYYSLATKRSREEPYCSRRIYTTTEVNQELARFVIRDEGPGFNLEELPDPTDPENLARPFGRGVMLMKTFFDDVSYNERGNEVTLIKRFSQSDDANGAD